MEDEQELQDLRDKLKDLKLQRFDDNDPVLKSYSQSATAEPINLKSRRRLEGHFGKIYAFEWGPDSQNIVSASQDANMFVWNAMFGLKVQGITLPSAWVMCCGYSPNGEFVSTAGLDNVVWIYKVQEGATEEIAIELTGHEGYISSCSFLNEKQMITTSGDCSAALWDLPSRRTITEFSEHTLDVNCSALSPDSHVFATGSCDSTIKLWDVRVGAHSIRTFVGHESDVNAVAFFPDGNAIVSGSDDSTCRLYDIRSYSMLNVFVESKHYSGVTSTAVSKSGKYIFSAYDTGPVYVWNTIHGDTAQFLEGHEKRVSRVRVSPDGSAVGTASWDTTIFVWA
jgi:guanine nucleotide-binding protein G(I)/G(S)/G(T) subunit beta-1